MPVMEKKKRKGDNHHALFPVFFSTLLFLLSHLPAPASAATNPGDAAAMQALAKTLNGLPKGWSSAPGADPCGGTKWPGVSCNGDRVASINLQDLQLTGTLPPDISSLSSLRSLSLQENAISGPLPSLDGMSSLQEIYLNNNSFTSITPSFFSGLTALANVSLEHNPLGNWTIPETLSGSANLVSFKAMNASLSGTIPDFLGTMPSLQVLRLSYNDLVGGIPDSFRGSGLRELDVNNQKTTQMSGRIDVLASMTQLQVVMLQSNNFSGPIPDLSNLTSLTNLILRGNHLTGPVPPSLTTLPALEDVQISSNLLQGPVPEFKNPTVWSGGDQKGNNFCNPKPGPCDPRVTALLNVAQGLGYPAVFATSWKGNDPCSSWMFVTCDPQGNITLLNLANQRLGGTISPAIADISSLKSIILNDNNLTGSIPDGLTKLPQLQSLDVSNNNLTGKVPTFDPKVKFVSSGNPLLGKEIDSGGSSGSGSGSASEGAPGKKSSLWIVLLVVIVTLVAALGGAFYVYRRKKRNQQFPPDVKKSQKQSPSSKKGAVAMGNQSNESSGSNGNAYMIGSDATFMSIQALRLATRDFTDENVLGMGGFGVVYKGEMPDGTLIAVKRMECSQMGKKGMTEFQAEIGVLTKVRHRHLVALLGFCVDGNERLLVYEYMPQGTLGQHIFDGIEKGYTPLNWKQRLTIALDVARGLEYLHTLAQKSFIHRDLKPSNILIDNDMRAKVSDFGLVKLAPDGKHSIETRLAGTFGYLAPEYATTGRVTTKVDVYAFGVVLMELITGRKVLDESLPDEYTHLVSWFRRVLLDQEKLRKSIDPNLDLNDEDYRSISIVAELSGHCTASEANQRPDMGHAVNVLAPLVDHWKPSSSSEEPSYSMCKSLSQRLKKWQESDDTYTGSDFDSHVESRQS